MNWHALGFEQLTGTQVYQLLQLRSEIFVVEQTCIYQDIDGHDLHPEALHLLGYRDDKLHAYLRLLPPGCSYPQMSIGRVLVSEAGRRDGLGSELMQRGLELARKQWGGQLCHISAQLHLQAFYENQGFVAVTESYLEDGIPHIGMEQTL